MDGCGASTVVTTKDLNYHPVPQARRDSIQCWREGEMVDTTVDEGSSSHSAIHNFSCRSIPVLIDASYLASKVRLLKS